MTKINLEIQGERPGNTALQKPYFYVRKTQRSKTQNHGQGTEVTQKVRITKYQKKGSYSWALATKLWWLFYLLTMKPVIYD